MDSAVQHLSQKMWCIVLYVKHMLNSRTTLCGWSYSCLVPSPDVGGLRTRLELIRELEAVYVLKLYKEDTSLFQCIPPQLQSHVQWCEVLLQ